MEKLLLDYENLFLFVSLFVFVIPHWDVNFRISGVLGGVG